jgi:hypothetical protein
MLAHSSSEISTKEADHLAQVLATQPLKVPVYNRMWLVGNAGTSDIYDRWWHVCHELGLCLRNNT